MMCLTWPIRLFFEKEPHVWYTSWAHMMTTCACAKVSCKSSPTSHNLPGALFDCLQRLRPCPSSRKFTPPPSSASSMMASTSYCPLQNCSWLEMMTPSSSSSMIPSMVLSAFLPLRIFLPFPPSQQLEDVCKERMSLLIALLETSPRSEWRTTKMRRFDASKKGF